MEQLKEFQNVSTAYFLVADLKNLTIRCECKEPEIELAINAFGAKVAEHGDVMEH